MDARIIVDASFTRWVQRTLSALMIVALTACCAEAPRVGYRFIGDFKLRLVRAELSESGAPVEVGERTDTRGAPFQGGDLKGMVVGQDYGLNVTLSSTSRYPITIRWSDAVYRDENGNVHALIPFEGGGLPRPDDPFVISTIPPNGKVFYTVVPQEKMRYVRVDCRHDAVDYDSILPWADAESPMAARSQVASLAEKSASVSFSIPFETAEQKDTLRLDFVLEPRRADGSFGPIIVN